MVEDMSSTDFVDPQGREKAVRPGGSMARAHKPAFSLYLGDMSSPTATQPWELENKRYSINDFMSLPWKFSLEIKSHPRIYEVKPTVIT